MFFMKKLFLILFLILSLCACGAEEAPEIPEENTPVSEAGSEAESEEAVPAEKVIVTIDGIDYEVFVPAETRFEIYDGGQVEIITPKDYKVPAIVDLSGLSGCEYITSLFVTLMSETESLILPELPNISNCEIDGYNPGNPVVDAVGIEGCGSLYVNIIPGDIEIGAGPMNLTLGYGFDLGMVAGSENVRMVMVHGENDLSKIAEIGPVAEVYLVGEGADLSGLENLKTLEKLSFHYYNGDLSLAGNLPMGVLVFENEISQETIDTFTYSETVYELQINDKFMTNLDILDKLPNLQTLVLSVDPIQPEEVAFWEETTDKSKIDALVTNLPKEKLKAFLSKGGSLFIMDDWNRT